jgi:hypothetical protein
LSVNQQGGDRIIGAAGRFLNLKGLEQVVALEPKEIYQLLGLGEGQDLVLEVSL